MIEAQNHLFGMFWKILQTVWVPKYCLSELENEPVCTNANSKPCATSYEAVVFYFSQIYIFF